MHKFGKHKKRFRFWILEQQDTVLFCRFYIIRVILPNLDAFLILILDIYASNRTRYVALSDILHFTKGAALSKEEYFLRC